MPKLGLISDSHGMATLTARGAALLVKHGATMLLHMGDICTEAVIDALVVAGPAGEGETIGEMIPVHITWGNNDEFTGAKGLGAYAQSLGMTTHYPSGVLFAGGAGEVGFTHGHLENVLSKLVLRNCPYILHGHSHVARDVKVGKSRLINPGALYRVGKASVALLDTESGQCRFFELARE
jgi:uncharacterized protein